MLYLGACGLFGDACICAHHVHIYCSTAAMCDQGKAARLLPTPLASVSQPVPCNVSGLLCCVMPGDKARGSLWLTTCTATDYGGSDTRFFTSCDSWSGQSGSPMWDKRGPDMYYLRAGTQAPANLLCTRAGLGSQPQPQPNSVVYCGV